MHENQKILKPTKPAYLLVCLAVAIVAGLVSVYLYHAELSFLESENANFVESRATRVQVEYETVDQHLAGLAAWISVQGRVTTSDFKQFGELSQWRRPGVINVGWVPRIDHHQRNEYESGALYGEPIKLWDIPASGKMSPAVERTEYFPLTILMDQSHPEAGILGFDMLSDPSRRAAVYMARDSGKTALNSGSRSNNNPDNPLRVLMFKPVFKACKIQDCVSETPRLLGMVAALLNVDALVNAQLGEMRPSGLDIYIKDIRSQTGVNKILYSHAAQRRQGKYAPQTLLQRTQSNARWTKVMDIGSRQWALTAVAVEPLHAKALMSALPIGLLILLPGLFLVGWNWSVRRNSHVINNTLQKLHETSRYKEFLATISNNIANVSVFGLDQEIESTLEQLAKLVHVDGSYIFLLREDGDTFDMAYEWRADPKERVLPQLQGLSLSSLPWFAQRIRNHEVSLVPDVDAMPDEAAPERAIFQSQGRKSLVDVPIVQTGKLLGFMGLDFTRGHTAWNAEIIEAIRVSGEILAAAFIRKKAYSDRLTAASEITHLRNYDALTGLPNRQQLLEHVAARRASSSQGLLVIDLRRFSRICDAWGAKAGDDFLCLVANRLEASVNSPDFAGRLGADVFAIVLNGASADPRHAQQLIDRLLSVIQSPITLGGQEVRLSCRSGVAYAAPGDTAAELLAKAEQALATAKRNGGSDSAVYEPLAHASARRLHSLQDKLRKAINTDEFELYFQPQFKLNPHSSPQLRGFEVLLRWPQPDGMIPPSDFIPVAEESGLILPIGAWVLKEAGHVMRRWLDRYPGVAFTIAINLSPLQFAQSDLTADIAALIRKHSLPPELLEFEITEGVLIQDIDYTGETLSKIRDLGVRFSVDDFGTGYSSLAYLQKLPLDDLKIDRSFINVITDECQDAPIVRATVSMAHDLGLSVIAEGVETQEQLDYLKAIGCDAVQGYFLGRPMPAAEAEVLLAKATPP